jgi:hypothetical protein
VRKRFLLCEHLLMHEEQGANSQMPLMYKDLFRQRTAKIFSSKNAKRIMIQMRQSERFDVNQSIHRGCPLSFFVIESAVDRMRISFFRKKRYSSRVPLRKCSRTVNNNGTKC